MKLWISTGITGRIKIKDEHAPNRMLYHQSDLRDEVYGSWEVADVNSTGIANVRNRSKAWPKGYAAPKFNIETLSQ